jgi:hypothetical protein
MRGVTLFSHWWELTGEDDLDAPDLNAPTPAEAGQEKPRPNGGTREGRKYWDQKKMLTNRAANEDLHSANPRLKAQLSAVLRDQLTSELKDVRSVEDFALAPKHRCTPWRPAPALEAIGRPECMNANDFRIGVFHGDEDIGPAFPDPT